jgi:hypothetical protein
MSEANPGYYSTMVRYRRNRIKRWNQIPDVAALIRATVVVAVALGCAPASAQQPQQQAPAQQPGEWAKLPRMVLERQFAGPLQDTIVQRWRDPADGMICYLYLPITAAHTPPTQSGYVQYGANTIGSISCVAGPPVARMQKNAPQH